ncbi:MAG TPA: hypothetical protein PLL66_04825 [Bacteroidales bacterium]|nr:hypothetical protein [Bacteroidales bacterium]
MKTKILSLFLISLFICGGIHIYAQTDSTTINKYQEFALFITGQEFPASVTDTTIDLTFWKDYQAKINVDWPEMDSTRLAPMANWRNDEISPKINDSLLLFYPFSGPDFLHAYVLFPYSSEYLFLAQEQLGEIPDLSKMKQKDLSDYLDKFYYSIRDIYIRSYFITGRMNTDLHNARVKGVLPVIIFFMSQTGHEIIDVSYEYVNSDGSFKPLSSVTGRFSATECVKISFKSKDSENDKVLRYFRCDISDEGFVNTPGFKTYLNSLDEVNTYVKSASYLLHYGTFSIIRNIILDNSKTVLQDDTGIPYKYFDITKWDAFLYGVYVKPIADFPSPYLMQNDLKKIYDEGGENVKELPFSLGYHWNSGEQNQMLFIRKNISE